MKQNIKRIPLLFLFLPTLFVVFTLFFTLDSQHQLTINEHFRFTAKHLIFHISEVSSQHLHQRRYGELKQVLWELVDMSESNIDNIMIYDADGQFVTALNLTEQVMESSLNDFQGEAFAEQDGVFSAYGPIERSIDNYSVNSPKDTLGYVRVVFISQKISLVTSSNMWLVFLIAMFGVLISLLLWSHRYGQFHSLMAKTIEFLINQNKGYKQAALVDKSQYFEVNQLQSQVNALVGFYEKRLTVKQFELTALEQSLRELNNSQFEPANATVDDTAHVIKQEPADNSGQLFTAMYQVMFQRLQERFAVIEHAIVDYYNAKRQLEQEHQIIIWSQENQLVGASNQLNQLLCEIKLLADATTGALRQPLEYIALEQLISSISHFVIPVANQKSLEFVVCQPDMPLDVELDINQSQQVLIALMQSAVASSDKGYIKLVVELLDLPEGKAKSDKRRLVCKVQDSGKGLTARQIAMLTDGTIDEGLSDDKWLDEGLRLMVAKIIVESMGGQFTVKSLKGLGAEVTVTFTCKVSFSTEQDLTAYNGCDILVYDPVIESGTVIYEKLCGHGMLGVHCKRLDEIEAVLNKGKVDCMICCRPVEPQAQRDFDKVVTSLIANHNIERCLMVAAKSGLPMALPQSWLLVEKPFVFNEFLDYFHPDMLKNSHEQSTANTAAKQVIPLDEHRISILAVDDNETNLKLLSSVLRDLPIDLVPSLSGREALTLSQQQLFDLVLMDKEMPQMDGIETSLSMRKLPINSTTPIVVFSANVDDAERKAIFAQGLDDCIEKPLSMDKLERLMDKFCKARWQSINAKA